MLRATLEQWRMFRAVVEYGGFSQAARAVHKSQSSIHHAVQKLEESLDVQLLEVTGRKAHLTQSGELMLRRARYLLEEASKVEAIAHSLKNGTESQLRIAIDEVFPQQVLYKTLENTSSQYPLLRIELMESILSGAEELLKNGQADIAITPFPFYEGYSEKLCQIEFVPVAHPSHTLHHHTSPLSLEDLKSHRQIVIRDSSANNNRDAGWLGSSQRWTVSHLHTSMSMLCKGLGFAWLPVNLVRESLSDNQLKILPVHQVGQRSTPLYLAFNDRDQLRPAAHTFIKELRYQTQQEK